MLKLNIMIKIYILFLLILILSIAGCRSDSSIELSEMSITTDRGVFYPAFDPGIRHYAASCGDGGIVSMSFVSPNQDLGIYVNNFRAKPRTRKFSGKPYQLSG
jgi:hypothetical protein